MDESVLDEEAKSMDETLKAGYPNYVTTLVIFVTTFLVIYYNTRRRTGVPPGPPLVPVVGNIFSLAGKDVLKSIQELRQQYGDVFSLYIGTELTVFLNGHEVIYDALVKKGSLFLRRPYSNYHKLVVQNPGVIYLNDRPWKAQRTLVLKAFNSLFFKNGGMHLKIIIEHETEKLINKLDLISKDNVPFYLEDTLLVSVANVISDLLFKRSFDFEDQEFLGNLKKVSKLAGEVGKMQVLCNCFPFLAKLPGDVLKAEYANETFREIIKSLRPHIDACKDDPNTFIGLYCEEMEKIEAEPGHKSENERYMDATTYDLLAAGSETTSTTLLWILMYLMNNPETQETMHSELLGVMEEKTRIISTDFTKQCPYSNAVIYEGIRISSAAPLAIPRTVPRDMTFRGHLIPENCTIITNLNSSLMDSSVWPDPKVFRPERFLDQSKTEVVVPKEFIPFSIGQRSCLGESLARMELFVFLASMVANFKFIPIDDHVPYDMEGILGLTWHPKAFKMRAVRR